MFKNKDGNRWLKDRESFEADLLQMADEASILWDSSTDLLKSLQNFTKSVGEEEKKHPFGKASKAIKAYAAGMRTSSASMTKSGEKFDHYYATCCGLKDNIGSSVLSKLISFKEVECKECDAQMTLLKKTYANCQKIKNKKNVDQVQLDAAEASLKKLLEEAKGTLSKFNKTGTELLTQMAIDLKRSFDTYCETGSA